MRQKTPFSARMAARLVEAAGGEWMPLGEEAHDPGVARDFVASLQPTHGPAVVRVEASGGTTRERDMVAGDWLCDGRDGGNLRVPAASWDGEVESLRWTEDHPEWLEAWEACERADWMLWQYAILDPPSCGVVRAACELARGMLHLLGPVAAGSASGALDAASSCPPTGASISSMESLSAKLDIGDVEDYVGRSAEQEEARRAVLGEPPAALFHGGSDGDLYGRLMAIDAVLYATSVAKEYASSALRSRRRGSVSVAADRAFEVAMQAETAYRGIYRGRSQERPCDTVRRCIPTYDALRAAAESKRRGDR